MSILKKIEKYILDVNTEGMEKYILTRGTIFLDHFYERTEFHRWMIIMTLILWNAATIEKLENAWKNKKSGNICENILKSYFKRIIKLN